MLVVVGAKLKVAFRKLVVDFDTFFSMDMLILLLITPEQSTILLTLLILVMTATISRRH